MAEMRGELLDALKIMRGEEVVDMRERGLHPARERLVAGGAEQRIQPDHVRTAAPKPRELTTEQLGVASIPSIRHDQHDGTVAHDAARPRRVERAQRIPDARAAAPVVQVAHHSRYDTMPA